MESIVVACCRHAQSLCSRCCFINLIALGAPSCGCALDSIVRSSLLLTGARHGAAGEHHKWLEYSQQVGKSCHVVLCTELHVYEARGVFMLS